MNCTRYVQCCLYARTCPHRYRSQLWMSLFWYIVHRTSLSVHLDMKVFLFHPLFCSLSFLLPFTPSLLHSPNPFHPPLCCILAINLCPVSSTRWVLSDLYSTAVCVFVSNFYLLAAMEVQPVAERRHSATFLHTLCQHKSCMTESKVQF